MQPRLPRFVVAVAAVAGFLAQSPRASADFVLDGFDNPSPRDFYQISLKNGNPYTSPTTTVGAGVTRTIEVMVSTPSAPDENSVSGFIGGGRFTMAANDDSAVNAKITYALTDGARNLTGATGLTLNFNRLDAGLTGTSNAANIPATIRIATDGGTLTRNVNLPSSAGPIDPSFDFSTFNGSGDLGNVNSITIVLNATLRANGTLNTNNSRTAIDLSLDAVTVKAVPAPPGLLLAGLGGLALLGRARLIRRKSATA